MENNGIIFIIFGITGDLAKRKLIPALFKLVKHKKLKRFALIGTARSNTNIKAIFSSAKQYIHYDNKNDLKTWKGLQKRSYYLPLDFYNKEDYSKLSLHLEQIEKEHKLIGNRVFYLATLPQHFDVITHNLQQQKLAQQTKQHWTKVIYEKPFQDDYISARKLNKCINRLFSEKQVYRIDHYLGKELVKDIAFIRFTNRILEPLWNNSHIDSVQIILDEDFGIENRAAFYDHYGAVRDVVQNHVLQLLALTTMEAPKQLSAEFIRNEKVKILRKTKIKDFMLGQYAGYTNEIGIKKSSKTETFAALKMEINTPRWKGIPIFVRTGKFLAKKETSIHIKFKEVDCLLAKNCPSDTNYFTIRIQPNDSFILELHAKVAGKKDQIMPVKLEFCKKCRFGPDTPEAYETLLEDVIKGDQSAFVRNDEIEAAWKVVDIVQKKKKKVYLYEKGSIGPEQLTTWNKKHNLRWHS